MSLLASPSLTSRTTSRRVGVREAQPGKGGPTQGDVLLGNANVELFLNVAATSVAAAILGLALSALARSNEQIMPLLVVLIISQLVFRGGMIPVAHRLVPDQLSRFTPAGGTLPRRPRRWT
jgi:hypothetical protein